MLRPFNGSLADARGILTIDQATFNDCPYPPERIVRLLMDGEQRAWVAEVEGRVVGFATAFPTRTLQVDGWEVDLVAVHPRHQRQGMGTALIKHAVVGAPDSGATQVRAVVAVKNSPSRRAFEAVGFQTLPETYHLMRCTVAGAAARPPVPGMEAIRPLAGEADAQAVLRLAQTSPRTVSQVIRLAGTEAHTLLVAERDGRISAFAELVKVQTLLYAGIWVERLIAPALSRKGSHPGQACLLIAAAVERAKDERIDEIGCLVAAPDWRLRQAFAGEGFVSAGQYVVMIRAFTRHSKALAVGENLGKRN